MDQGNQRDRVAKKMNVAKLHLRTNLQIQIKIQTRDPWVAQRFGACLWPRARPWRLGIQSHVGLPVHGACFSLCLCLCLSLSQSVTIMNK